MMGGLEEWEGSHSSSEMVEEWWSSKGLIGGWGEFKLKFKS
jgi:hypothetical protein